MKQDFDGKKVFVGIDVHKKKFAVCAVSDGAIVEKVSMNSDHQGLIAYLKGHFPAAKIICAYEAGFSGYELHRFLEGNGIDCLVVHAASIEIHSYSRSGNGTKTSYFKRQRTAG
jgi:transposase